MSWHRRLSIVVLATGLAGFLWMRGCDTPLPDIEVREGMIHVRNQSGQEWHNVRILVNEYYAVAVRSIPPAGFVRQPVSRFQTGWGQTINTATTPITSVVVQGTGDDGEPVRVTWRPPTHR